MIKIILALFAVSITLSTSAQTLKNKERLFVNFGAGPSYSLFYNSGGWVRDWGNANVNNVTESRQAWSFSHFAELEWRFRNPRWSVRAGYASHHYYPEFKKTGFDAWGNTYYEIDTRESDTYNYIKLTAHYALLDNKRSRLEVGTGLYTYFGKRQEIYHYTLYSTPNGPRPTFFVSNYHNSEGGFPFNVDYLWKLKNGNGIGVRGNLNYTQSVQTLEDVSLFVMFKARLH